MRLRKPYGCDCPKCGAKGDDSCRGPGGRSVQAHRERLMAHLEACKREFLQRCQRQFQQGVDE